jgi:hypothetical protein
MRTRLAEYAAYMRNETYIQNNSRKPDGKDNLRDLVFDRRTILKWILKK